jgi:hypothetical protein
MISGFIYLVKNTGDGPFKHDSELPPFVRQFLGHRNDNQLLKEYPSPWIRKYQWVIPESIWAVHNHCATNIQYQANR